MYREGMFFCESKAPGGEILKRGGGFVLQHVPLQCCYKYTYSNERKGTKIAARELDRHDIAENKDAPLTSCVLRCRAQATQQTGQKAVTLLSVSASFLRHIHGWQMPDTLSNTGVDCNRLLLCDPRVCRV